MTSLAVASSRGAARLAVGALLAVDETLFPSIEGTTDAEMMFYLALTFGLENRPGRRSREDSRLRAVSTDLLKPPVQFIQPG